MPPWALSSKLLNLGSSLLTLPATSDAFRRLAIFFGLFKFNSTGLYVFRCKQLNLEKLLYNQKKLFSSQGAEESHIKARRMLSQNHGFDNGARSSLDNISDRFGSLDQLSSSEQFLKFAMFQAELLFKFGIQVIEQFDQRSQNSSIDVRSWLMTKAQEYDDRCKTLNPCLDSRSNDELLNFIIICASSEAKNSHS
jgi:hypothetical protein